MHQESTAQGLQCSVQHSLQVQVLLLAVQLEEMHPHICSVPLSSAAYLWVLKKCCLSFIRLPVFFNLSLYILHKLALFLEEHSIERLHLCNSFPA